MNKEGKLIVVEGPDGCGKSSLCRNVVKHLTGKDIDIKSIGLPYKSRSHSYILIQEAISNKLPVDVIQSLMIMNIRNILNATVSDLLSKGTNVLLDRWLLSTLIYDDAQNGILTESVRKYIDKSGIIDIYDFSKKYCKISVYPDIVLYYIPDKDIVISHAKRREKNKKCDFNDTADQVIKQYYLYNNYYNYIKYNMNVVDNHAIHERITSDLKDEKEVYKDMTNQAISIIEKIIG